MGGFLKLGGLLEKFALRKLYGHVEILRTFVQYTV